MNKSAWLRGRKASWPRARGVRRPRGRLNSETTGDRSHRVPETATDIARAEPPPHPRGGGDRHHSPVPGRRRRRPDLRRAPPCRVAAYPTYSCGRLKMRSSRTHTGRLRGPGGERGDARGEHADSGEGDDRPEAAPPGSEVAQQCTGRTAGHHGDAEPADHHTRGAGGAVGCDEADRGDRGDRPEPGVGETVQEAGHQQHREADGAPSTASARTPFGTTRSTQRPGTAPPCCPASSGTRTMWPSSSLSSWPGSYARTGSRSSSAPVAAIPSPTVTRDGAVCGSRPATTAARCAKPPTPALRLPAPRLGWVTDAEFGHPHHPAHVGD